MIQRKSNALSYQKGYLAVVAVLLIVVVGFLGVATIQMFFGESRATTDFLQAAKAFYLAESGLEHATYKLVSPTLSTRIACNGLSLSNTLGGGDYTVTSSSSTYISSPTTVSGALSASATTIPVVSTTGYESFGRIMIDSEFINYSSINATNFLGATRGVDGSTATTHALGAKVGQYQCDLLSEGGVPSLTPPSIPNDPFAKRTLQASVQLSEAWLVGNVSSGRFTFARWNNPTQNAWNNSFLTSGSSAILNAISMSSLVDGWAVGASARFLRWNGSTWTLTTVTPNVTYNDVKCIASNACFAVGNNSSGALVLSWNGTAWSRVTISGSQTNNLNALSCGSPTSCWAIGATSSLYQYNGSTWTRVIQSSLSAYPYTSIACPSSTECWAVGGNATFARYSSGTWSNVATGLPSAQYNSIICNSSSDCWAVGNVNSTRDLIVHWNGSAWSRNASNPTPTVNLTGVSCAAANDCWAAGSTSSGGIIHWDGSSWTTVSTSLTTGITINALSVIGPRSKPQSAWQEIFA